MREVLTEVAKNLNAQAKKPMTKRDAAAVKLQSLFRGRKVRQAPKTVTGGRRKRRTRRRKTSRRRKSCRYGVKSNGKCRKTKKRKSRRRSRVRYIRPALHGDYLGSVLNKPEGVSYRDMLEDQSARSLGAKLLGKSDAPTSYLGGRKRRSKRSARRSKRSARRSKRSARRSRRKSRRSRK